MLNAELKCSYTAWPKIIIIVVVVIIIIIIFKIYIII